MTDVFFSYSSKDRERVRNLHDRLVAHGFDVFWDQAVPAGTNWDTWIRQHLTRAKCAIVAWSNSSVGSDNVVHEATVAKQQGKLLPVLLDPLGADQFPMGLYTVQAANLCSWTGDAGEPVFQQLLGDLETKLAPLWIRRTIDRLEAELVAERARREATERRDRTLQEQISKEAQAQIDIIRERDQAVASTEAVQAELVSTRKALAESRQEVIELSSQLKSATDRLALIATVSPPLIAASPSPPAADLPVRTAVLAAAGGTKVGAGTEAEEIKLWTLASSPDTSYGDELWLKKQYLEKYLAEFRHGAHVDRARTELRRVLDVMAWEAARRSGRRADMQAYIDRYPAGQFASEARRIIESKKWF